MHVSFHFFKIRFTRELVVMMQNGNIVFLVLKFTLIKLSCLHVKNVKFLSHFTSYEVVQISKVSNGEEHLSS